MLFCKMVQHTFLVKGIVTVFFLFNAFFLSAQDQLSGTVQDITNNKLEGASVVLKDKGGSILQATTTNQQGVFSLSKTQKAYELEISYVGYSIFKSNVKGKTQLGFITLKTDGNLKEVEVVTKLDIEIKRGKGKYVINLDKTTFEDTSNVWEGLKQIPIIRIDEGVIKVNNRVSIVEIDGIQTILKSKDLQSFLEALNPQTIRSVEIISNPNAAYDSEVDAVINIITKKDTEDSFFGVKSNNQKRTHFNTDNALIYLRNTEKLKLYTNYTFAQAELLNTTQFERKIKELPLQEITYTEPVKKNAHNLLFNIDLNLSPKSKLNLSQILEIGNSNLTGSATSTSFYDNTLKFQSSHTRFHLVQSFSTKFNEDMSFKFRLFEILDTQQITKTENVVGFPLETRTETQRFNKQIPFLTGTFDGIWKNTLGETTVGFKYNFINIRNNNFTNINTSIDLEAPFRYVENTLSAYLNQRIDFSSTSFLSTGVRWELSFADYLVPLNFTRLLIIPINFRYATVLFHASYSMKTPKEWLHTFSFRKVIKRPPFAFLNPFIEINNGITYDSGNFGLLPPREYSFNYEFGNKNFFTSLNLGYIEKFISPVLELQNDLIVNTYSNIDLKKFVSLELNYNNSFFNGFWTTSLKADGSYLELFDADDNPNNDLPEFFNDIRKATPQLRFSTVNTFKLHKNLFLNFSYLYRNTYSNAIQTLFETQRFDVSVTKKINSFQLLFYATDVFKTNRIIREADYTNFYFKANSYPDLFSVGVSVSWNLSDKSGKKSSNYNITDSNALGRFSN